MKRLLRYAPLHRGSSFAVHECEYVWPASVCHSSSVYSLQIPIECVDGIADIIDVVIRHGHVDGKHQHARKQPVCVRQVLCEAESFQMVDCLTIPLDECAHSAIEEVRLQGIAILRLDLVILIDIEVIRIRIWSGSTISGISASRSV